MTVALRGFTPGPGVEPVTLPLRLHLGCGRTILKGWVNVDRIALRGVDLTADLNACLTRCLPFEDDSVDEFLMSHVIEHITDTLSLMQELHRIAKPGAILTARTPYGSSDDAWEDPTHVRAYFIQSWGYFSQPYHWRSESGYRGDWQPETLELAVDKQENEGVTPKDILARVFAERNVVKEMVATLRCVKPIREQKRELQVLPRITFTLV